MLHACILEPVGLRVVVLSSNRMIGHSIYFYIPSHNPFVGTQMKILVAYYSWKGHTETVARELAGKLNATIVKIEPLTDPGPGMFGKVLKAIFGMKDSIKPCQIDLKEFDHLVIATPVWAHKIPPYTRQYIAQLTNCSGKKFSILTEMGKSGAEGAIGIVRKLLQAKGMTFIASAATVEKDVEAKQVGATIEDFAKKIQAR